jgi:hypothetical protein
MIDFTRCTVCFARSDRLHGVGHPTLGMITLCKDCYKLWSKNDINALRARDPRPLVLGL